MIVSQGASLFDVEHLDEIAHVKHGKNEKKWHGKCIKYYRKGMRETEHVKINEQLSLEGKNTQRKRELKNEMIKWQENGSIVLWGDLRYIPDLKPINGPTTREFREQAFTSRPLGGCRRLPLESWPSREGLAPINTPLGASLVVQWLRIHLPMQGTLVRALVREDPTCRGATKPVSHNSWACALEPASHNYWAHTPQLLKPARLEPVLHNKRSHCNEKPVHHKEE